MNARTHKRVSPLTLPCACVNVYTNTTCSVYQISTQVQTGIFIKYSLQLAILVNKVEALLTSQLASAVELSSASATPLMVSP